MSVGDVLITVGVSAVFALICLLGEMICLAFESAGRFFKR